MNSIGLVELHFTAEGAINHRFTRDHAQAIQSAIVRAINEYSEGNLVIGQSDFSLKTLEESWVNLTFP
jgi:hypothetical protein